MTRTLQPRTYLAVDRLTKLFGLLFMTAGLAGMLGPFPVPLADTFAIPMVLVGAVLGVLTVFFESDEADEA